MAKYYFLLELESDEVPAKLNTVTGLVTTMVSKAPTIPDGKTYANLHEDSIIKFGKHKGEFLSDVIKADVEYGKWFIGTYKGKIDPGVMRLLEREQKNQYTSKILK